MFSLTLPKRDERGFTLIELLVVIIVIGILAAIAIPLFLDQRKLAVDASVKSDVRNTATQVQTWQATNQGVVATDAADYAAKGGNVSKSTGNTVKLSVATDGSYLVCGYAGTSAKQYTATTAAYVYDSTTGRFGLGDCASGIVGAGSPSSSPSTTAPVSAFPVTYNFNDGTTQGWTSTRTGTLNTTTVGARTALHTASTYVYNTSNTAASITANKLTVGKSYTLSGSVYLSAGSAAYLAYLDGSNYQQTGSVSAVGTWTSVSKTFTATASSGSIIVANFSSSTGSNPVEASFDDVTLTEN